MAKPPIGATVNPAHALAPAHCWLMNEAAGQPRDIGVTGLPAPAGDIPAWTTEGGDPVINWDGTKHCDYGTGPLLAGKSKFTVVVSVHPADIGHTGGWLVKRLAYQQQAAMVIGMMHTSDWGDFVIFEIGDEFSGDLVYAWYAWSPTGDYSDQVVPTSLQQLIFSYDGSLAAQQRVKLYKNGTLVPGGLAGGQGADGHPALADVANKAVGVTTAPIWIAQGAGQGQPTTSSEYHGTMSYLYVIPDVAVSAAQVTSLFAAPFPFITTSPLLTAITETALAPTSVTITWTTEVAASSRVEYGVGNFASVVDVATPVTSHSVLLPGLTPASNYQYRVKSTITGPVTATSSSYAFTTPTAPAVVGPILVDRLSSTKMRVSVTTDVLTTAVLDYGTTTAYGSQIADATSSTVHRFSLTGLTANTSYNLRVTASTAAPISTTQTPNRVAKTRLADAVAPVAISDLSVLASRVTQTGVRLRWTAPSDASAGRVASYTVKRSGQTAGGMVSSENYRANPLLVGDVPPEHQVGAGGWTNPTADVDWSSGLDRRLAGYLARGNDGTQATRVITLPATGPYRLRLALGASPARIPQWFQVQDNTTPVLTLDMDAGNPANEWYDAQGVSRTESSWVAAYDTSFVDRTFSSTTLRLVLGTPTAEGDHYSTLAHFSVEALSGGGITSGTFDSAVTVPQSLTPRMAGAIEELEVSGLSPNGAYTFALKSTDAEGNLSAMSNVVSATTLATRAPMDLWGGDLRIQSPTGKNAGCSFSRVSTSLTATVLTDTSGGFPTDGRLIGKLICPNTAFVSSVPPDGAPLLGVGAGFGVRNVWFRIIANTATTITTDAADGSMLVDGQAAVGNTYRISAVFAIEKVGDQWWFIDPEGNGFFPRMASVLLDKYQGSFPSASPHQAIFCERAAGGVTMANLAFQGSTTALNPPDAPGDVVNGTGVTVHLVNDKFYIGGQRPFGETYFQMQAGAVGTGGVMDWYYSISTGPGWKKCGVAQNGRPAEIRLNTNLYGAPLVDTMWAFNITDVGGGPQPGGGYDNGLRVRWFLSPSQYPAPSDWAPVVVPNTDGVARYYIRGVVTTQFTVDPKVNACFDNTFGAHLLDLKYMHASIGPAEDTTAKFKSIGMVGSGYASSYGDYAADEGLVQHMPIYGGTLVTYYANKGTNIAPKNIYENVPNSGTSDITDATQERRHQADMWHPPLVAGSAAQIATYPFRANPNNLYDTTDEPDFLYGMSSAGPRTHMVYCILATNPWRQYTWEWPGTGRIVAADQRFFGKYAMRDFLRYRYKPAAESMTAPSRSMTTPLYTYAAGVPTSNELTALNNLNAAWGTSYTTWATQSGNLLTGTNLWGTGTGFMDEDGRNILQAGIYPPKATGGADSDISYDNLGSRLKTAAIYQDVENFATFSADRYTYIVYDQVRLRTPNLVGNFLYDPPDSMALTLAQHTDVKWTATARWNVLGADPVYHEPGKILREWEKNHVPIIYDLYTHTAEDSPLSYGGVISAVSYHAPSNTTAITYTGAPIRIRNHVIKYIKLLDVLGSNVRLKWCQIYNFIGNTVYVRDVDGVGDLTGRAIIGQRIISADVNEFQIGVSPDPPTQEESAVADRDDIVMPIFNARAPDGTYPIIGYEKWQPDNTPWYPSETTPWGLTTHNFNLYDGLVEGVSAVSQDANGVWRGGEDRDYGDYITTMRAMWFGIEDALVLRSTVPVLPSFISAASATWDRDVLMTFHVVTSAAPSATLTLLSGTLPTGVALLDNGDGSAILGGQTTATGTFNLTFRATNSRGVTDQAFTLVVSGSDITPPVVTITTPTTAATFASTASPLALGGTASDNVAVTSVTWTNSTGGTGTAAGTATWTASIPLSVGSNVITVIAHDAAGNNSIADVLTVTYSTDTVAPTVVIVSPTGAPTIAVSVPSIVLAGTADDNVGVTQVTWVNDRGGSGSAVLS